MRARSRCAWHRRTPLAGRPSPATPHRVIGLPAVIVEADDDTLARRERVLADVQEHYYAHPPRIERGWREFLADIDGRVYLDMVNNVTSVGHAHPTVVEAATPADATAQHQLTLQLPGDR